MLKTVQTPLSFSKYYLFAIFFLLFLVFVSQKQDLEFTTVGISLTLLSAFTLMKIKDSHYFNRITSLKGKTKEAYTLFENDGAYAQFDKNFDLTFTSKEFIGTLGIEDGNLLTILKNCLKDKEIINKIKSAVKHNRSFNDMIELNIANETLYIDTFIHKIGNKNLTKPAYIIRCNDITSYIKTETELKNQLLLDPATKLPTRSKLVSDLQKPISTKSTHAQTLLYIQIDAYEEFNEFFGIDTSACLMKEISTWLAANLPTKNTQLYKFEHNNFAMHTTSRINLADLETYLKTLHTKINQEHFLIDDVHHDISFTIGIARGKERLLKHAYLAMKEAQKTHKPYKLFNKNNHQEEKFHQNMQTNKNIKSALSEDRVVPFFQPILNIATNEVEKFESLMRIQNEDNTHLRPMDFLEIAKQSKLYPALTKAMITASLKRLEFLQHPITINIAIDDILNSKVSSFIIRRLEKHPYAHLVTFEILETNEILNYTKVANFIKKVKALNCSVAIDDFGSGYSNFEQVLKLDIDYIKIDGSLIKNIDTNKESELVTKTIISFAKELGVKTIAEFVSSEAIFNKVKTLGIDYAQGYYIGKPAPIAPTN